LEWIIHQQITIHRLEVGSVANSSILQIGSAGLIKGLAQLYNTGGFTGPAPQLSVPAPAGSPPYPAPLPADFSAPPSAAHSAAIPEASGTDGPGGASLVPLPPPADQAGMGRGSPAAVCCLV